MKHGVLLSGTPGIDGLFVSHTICTSAQPSAFLDLNPAFMLECGVTSKEPQCLVTLKGTDARLGVESCAEASSAGDGRGLFALQANGQLYTTAGKRCLVADGQTQQDGQHVLKLGSCDYRGPGTLAWRVAPDASMKALPLDSTGVNGISQKDPLCLSLAGPGPPGEYDAARNSAATATSSAESVTHGAACAVDGDTSTYWASEVDAERPTVLAVNLGKSVPISSVDIDWECSAQDFSVESNATGEPEDWVTRYTSPSQLHSPGQAADDVQRTTHIPLDGAEASAVRVAMRGTTLHCGEGSSGGRMSHAFAVRRLALHSPRLTPVLDDCSRATKSGDARGKWFLAGIRQFDPAKRIPAVSGRAQQMFL